MTNYIIKVNCECGNNSIYLDLYKNGKLIANDVFFDADDHYANDSADAKEILYVLFLGSNNPRKAIKYLIKNPKMGLYVETDD